MIRALIVATAAAGSIAGLGVGAAPIAAADPPYANCDAARADGASNMTRDHPGYRPPLDRDDDGIACES